MPNLGLLVIHWRSLDMSTKYEVSIVNRSENIVGKIQKGSCDQSHGALRVIFFICWQQAWYNLSVYAV